jgi:hypothetical protein
MTQVEIFLSVLVAIQFVMSTCLFGMISCVNEKFEILQKYLGLGQSSTHAPQSVEQVDATIARIDAETTRLSQSYRNKQNNSNE